MRRSVWALLGALLVPTSLAAQDAPAVTPTPPPGRYQIGPVYLTPRLVLKHAGSESNVYNTGTRPIDDTAVGIEPMLQVVVPVGYRLRLNTTGALTINHFGREATERSVDRRVFGGVEARLARVTLRADGGISQGRDRFSIEVDERVDRRQTMVGFGAALQVSTRISLDGYHRITRSLHEDGNSEASDISDALDREAKSYRAALRFDVTDATALLFQADLTDDHFLEEMSVRDTARSRRLAAGFEFGVLGFLRGRAMAGVRDHPEGPTQAAPPNRGLSLDLDVTFPFLLGSQMALSAARDVQYSALARTGLEATRNGFVHSQYAGRLSFELPWSLVTRAGYRYETARYLEDRGEEDLTLHGYQISLLRAIGDSFLVGGTAVGTRRQGRTYNSLRYGLTAEWTP